jgi:glycosyltransferase involved in cell wall biosynthesis
MIKISIITVCYNSGRYLERAINSVLNQDFDNWEHIIIDGGSQDNTINILNKYEHLLWISEPDEGQSDAMNKGFTKCTGDIIIYLNADDELNPGLLTVVQEHFSRKPDTDMLILNLDTVKDEETTLTKPSIFLTEILYFYKYRFPLNPVSYAYKKSLQSKIGPFPIDNHYAMDYWFLLRAYLLGNVRYENFTGGIFYFDGLNKSADQANSFKQMEKVRNAFIIKFFYQRTVLMFVLKLFKTNLHYVWLALKK